MINAKLEDAIVVGPHLVHVSQTGDNKRSRGKRKHGDGANSPSVRLPALEFPAVECDGILPFIAAKIFNLNPTSSCLAKGNNRIYFRRAPRWKVAGQHCDRKQKER